MLGGNSYDIYAQLVTVDIHAAVETVIVIR